MFVHGNTRKRGELEIYFSPHVCRGIYAKKRTFFYLGLMGVRFFVVLGYMLNILFMAHFFCVSLFAAPPPFFPSSFLLVPAVACRVFSLSFFLGQIQLKSGVNTVRGKFLGRWLFPLSTTVRCLLHFSSRRDIHPPLFPPRRLASSCAYPRGRALSAVPFPLIFYSTTAYRTLMS